MPCRPTEEGRNERMGAVLLALVVGVLGGASCAPASVGSSPSVSLPPAATAGSRASSPSLVEGSGTATPSRGPGVDRITAKGRFGDYRLRMECTGSAAPTVILEYGIGGGVYPAWLTLRGPISAFARVCTYQRTDFAPTPPEPLGISRSLRRLLERALIEPPFVLVGHSWGAIYMRVFAHEFPGDAAGLVLVDPSHPEQASRFLAALGPAGSGDAAAVVRAREEFELFASDPMTVTSARQVRPATSLGNQPVIVLSAAGAGDPSLPPDAAGAVHGAWLEMHSEMAGLSTNSVHVIATQSAHNIPADQPALTIEAIRRVVEAARSGTLLPPCGADLEQLNGACVDGRMRP